MIPESVIDSRTDHIQTGHIQTGHFQTGYFLTIAPSPVNMAEIESASLF